MNARIAKERIKTPMHIRFLKLNQKGSKVTGPHDNEGARFVQGQIDSNVENERRDALRDNLFGRQRAASTYTVTSAGWPLIFGVIWGLHGALETHALWGTLVQAAKGALAGLCISLVIWMVRKAGGALFENLDDAQDQIGTRSRWWKVGAGIGALIGAADALLFRESLSTAVVVLALLGAIAGYALWFVAAAISKLRRATKG